MSTFRESIHIQSSNDPALIAIHIDLKQLNIILFSFFFYIYTFKGLSGEVCKHYLMETPLHISNREFTADSSVSQLVAQYFPLLHQLGMPSQATALPGAVTSSPFSLLVCTVHIAWAQTYSTGQEEFQLSV